MMVEIIVWGIVGIIVGMACDRILFGFWHKGAHSKKLRLEEDKQIDIEWENGQGFKRD